MLIILYVSDQARSRDLYCALLGARPVLDVPGMTEIPLSADTRLGLMPEQGIARILGPALPHPASGQGIPRCELYLDSADPDADYARALALGLRPVSPPADRDWGHRVAYLADPDGHVVAFARELAGEGDS